MSTLAIVAALWVFAPFTGIVVITKLRSKQ